MWCDGTGIAMVVDDDGNVLSRGKPLPPKASLADSATVPEYGGAQARQDAWSVLLSSKNTTWAARWPAACRVATGAEGEEPSLARADADDDEFEDEDLELHDEL